MNGKPTFRFLIPTALLCLAALSLKAQGMVVTLKTGGTESYPLSDIRSIRFDEERMFIHRNDGSIVERTIADIEKYSFDKASSVPDGLAERPRLRLFPNPTAAELSVVLTLPGSAEVQVEILDAGGRVLAELYRGPQQGEAIYRWEGNQRGTLPAGQYLCRVLAGGQWITQSFLIQ